MHVLLVLPAFLSVAAAAGDRIDCTPDIQLGSMFRSGQAVLQRAPARPSIFGTAPPNADLTVTIAGQAQQIKADAGGKWTMRSPALPAGWNVRLTVKSSAAAGSSSSCAVDTSVRFGETLLCAGQSNMGMPVVATSPCCSAPAPRPRSCHCFAAQNGTAEIAAAGRYSGKIVVASVQTLSGAASGSHNGTYCPYPWTNRSCLSAPEWNAVVPGMAGTIAKFSAICWYTGVALFESLGGDVPVGLMAGAVGGSPIEFWLPPGHVNASAHCGKDDPPCDHGGKNGYVDSDFWNQLLRPFAPYTVGTTIWDQGERDAHCLPQPDKTTVPENHVARYGCMLRELVSSWRAAFDEVHPFRFVAVQLPGYLGDCGTYAQCAASVFPMRLQQQQGLIGLDNVTTTPTYDLSCPPGTDFSTQTATCPFGTVHNVFKRQIGARLASQIVARMKETTRRGVTGGTRNGMESPAQQQPGAGPALARVTVAAATLDQTVTVNVSFAVPVLQSPTLNCVACCTKGDVGDFDASFDDGATWVNGTRPQPAVGDDTTLQFKVALPTGKGTVTPTVTHVRYTANQPFPQCAVYARRGGGGGKGAIPAMPFEVHAYRQ